MLPCYRSSRSTAFTLVELLMVIVIVGLLAALAFPVFAKARERSRQSVCANNLRQIGMAIKMYVADFDETHPPDRISDPSDGWAFVVQPYLKNTQVLQCPSEPTPANPDPSKSGYSDYLYNRYVLGLSSATVVSPTNTILCLDGLYGDAAMWDSGSDEDGGGCHGDSTSVEARPAPARWLARKQERQTLNYGTRHSEAANYLLADGHVQTAPPLSIWNNCTPPQSRISFAFK